MAVSFDDAIATLLEHEGGFVDDHDDPGGATNWGISLRWLRSVETEADVERVRTLTRRDAVELYRVHWWERGGYADLYDQRIASKAFNLAVNMGHGPAVKILQRALRACELPVVEDGIMGPQTRGAVLAADYQSLLAAMRSEAAGHYRVLVAREPARGKWIAGWLARAYS